MYKMTFFKIFLLGVMALEAMPGEQWGDDEVSGAYYMSPYGGYIDYFGAQELPPIGGQLAPSDIQQGIQPQGCNQPKRTRRKWGWKKQFQTQTAEKQL